MAKLIGFEIPDELHEELRQVAFETRRTKSDIFREALRVYLAEIKEPF